MCDPYYRQMVEVEDFKKYIEKFGLVLTRGQQNRIIMVLDEDMNGSISREEYFNALEAYKIAGEQH